MKTLFVVGNQPIKDIFKQLEPRGTFQHVFLAAEKSFDTSDIRYYNDTIDNLDHNGYWVTLEIPVNYYPAMRTNILWPTWKKSKFIPLISCEVPFIHEFDNLSIKIDDIEMDATNKGVWCIHPTKDDPSFTPWIAYSSDEPIKPVINSV